MSRRSAVGRLFAFWGAMTVVAGLLVAGTVTMAAEAQARQPVEILSPTRGAVHASGTHPLQVRVRVAPGVRNLRAVLSTRRNRIITKRFRRGPGRTVTATLRLGREVTRGPGAVRVSGLYRGGRVATSAHFFVASRPARLMRVTGLPSRVAARPLQLRMKTARRVAGVRVRVNGRGATDVFKRTAGGLWRGTLSADEGLRFGRNRVVITAFDQDGFFHRVNRVVNVHRARPLVGAGKDQLVKVRKPVRLDGRATRPHSRGGKRLRFAWRMVSRPRGSRARISNPRAIRPRFHPDLPGIYRVRLAVAPHRAGNTRGARASALAAVRGAADVTAVSAQPVAPPEGISAGTVGSDSGPGLWVAPNWYAMAGGAVQLLVLDGSTLQPLTNVTYAGNDTGVGNLISAVNGVDQDSVVMIQNPSSRPLTLSSSTVNKLKGMFTQLGIDAADRSTGNWLSAGMPASGWSVVSSTGAAPGTGRGMISLKEAGNRPVGEMDGFLQNTAGSTRTSAGSSYVFNWTRTFNTFETHSGGDGSTNNEMTIAGQTYSSDTIAEGTSAFHLVWLDGGSLELLGNRTVPGNDGAQLANVLSTIDNGPSPAVLFMITIGKPGVPRNPDGATNGWATVAEKIASLGGNANAFLALDGSGRAGYSLVGVSGIGEQAPNAGLDASMNLRSDLVTPNLIGVLERRPTGVWSVASGGHPSTPSDITALEPDIKQVLAQPAQPFQSFTGTGQAEAEAYIANALNLAMDPTYGIRVNYWDPGVNDRWDLLSSHITDQNIVPPCTTSPCNEGFASVVAQLDREFLAVATVRGYFDSYTQGTLFAALNSEFESGQWSFDQIDNYITSLYPPQPVVAHGPSPFTIIKSMLDIGAHLLPEGGAALAVAGAAVEIGGTFAEASQGSTYLGATVFEAQAAQFASTLKSQYLAGLDGLSRVSDLLVSDAGRLAAANTKVATDWQLSDVSGINGALDRSISSYMWTSLLPTTFKAYQCVVPPVYYPPETFRPAPWYPVSMKPDLLSYTPFTTVTHHPNPQQWGPMNTDGSQIGDGFVTIGRYFQGEHRFLDSTVAGNLFGPIDGQRPQQLGMLPQYLASPQPSKGNSPGFDVDQGSFDPRTDANDDGSGGPAYVSYTCVGNTWHEDTNVRGQ